MNEELDRMIESLRTYEMSPEERKEQAISWVYGQLAIDDPSVTKDSVRRLMEDHAGLWKKMSGATNGESK